jgi:leader peptidase (prepilin peptidase)/N-methyltransferase
MIVLMEQLLICMVLVALGLCMGSFAGATVWRLRARQLVQDKGAGEKVDEKEYRSLLSLTKTTPTTDRSRCLHCGHGLQWYDLIPLVSWAGTGGRCRYCNERIGWFEPLMELGVAAIFVALYLLWPDALQSPAAIFEFALWLMACVVLAILFAYDLRWFLLPNYAVFPLIGVAIMVAVVNIVESSDVVAALINLFASVVILSGLYLLLWFVSKGRWIGFGDVKLGLALALLLGDWRLAFITLFAANLLGSLVVIPGMLAGKMSRKAHVPFGPLLIAGCVIAALWGSSIIDWYFLVFL